MIDYSKLENLTIPEGVVDEIEVGGEVLWGRPKFRYVSLGDSIAAAHNSYANLIGNKLASRYGERHIIASNLATSGDAVEDLMNQLDEDETYSAVKKADVVTICIGANDILAKNINTEALMSYFKYGSPALNDISDSIDDCLVVLETDTATYSYRKLFDKLNGINPKATYIFTTVYNPYKYFWVDESTRENDYKDGFFGTFARYGGECKTDLGEQTVKYVIRDIYYNEVIQQVIDRINGPSRDGSDGIATFVEEKVTALNKILRGKIEEYRDEGHTNFVLTDTKILYDSIPDRPYANATIHYNDLVNVEITRGFDATQFNWGALWENVNWDEDISTILNSLVPIFLDEVLAPDIDPHPEDAGQERLACSFINAINNTLNIGLENPLLTDYTITYNANGGTGAVAPRTVRTSVNSSAITAADYSKYTAPSGYRFVAWNTKSDGTGSWYSPNDAISITSDITLYAIWSNQAVIRYSHSNYNTLFGDDETGHQESYALYINGVEMPDFSTFASGSITAYSVPIGSSIRVVVSDYKDNDIFYADGTCDVYWNGVSQVSGRTAEHTFTLDRDIDIDFRWKIAGSLMTADAESWEDCYIKTLGDSYLKLTQPYSISYNANGGSGSMATQKILQMDGWSCLTTIPLLAFTHPTTGYYFTGWKDQSSNNYSNGQLISVSSDITLSAQWSNLYKLTYANSSNHDDINYAAYPDDSNTGPEELYDFYINGVEQGSLGYISNPDKIYYLPYGTTIKVRVASKYSQASDIYWNGPSLLSGMDITHEFPLTSDTKVEFVWRLRNTVIYNPQSYWDCNITTS